jgi:SRSO17 transposase
MPPRGYALLDKRLFLPEEWFTDAYAARRVTCKVPPELTFHTKPQLAAQMLKTLHDAEIVPFTYMVADCLYGNRPEFLEAVERDVDLVYVVAIPADTRAWLQGPVMETKQYRYRGEVRTKRQVIAKDRVPSAVAAIANSIPDACWYRRTVSEGTKARSSMSSPNVG